MNRRLVPIVFIVCAFLACSTDKQTASISFNAKSSFEQTLPQLDLLLKDAYEADWIPRTVESDGETKFVGQRFDWTEGFFPGTLWYAYSFTKDEKYKKAAEYFQNKFIEQNHN